MIRVPNAGQPIRTSKQFFCSQLCADRANALGLAAHYRYSRLFTEIVANRFEIDVSHNGCWSTCNPFCVLSNPQRNALRGSGVRLFSGHQRTRSLGCKR